MSVFMWRWDVNALQKSTSTETTICQSISSNLASHSWWILWSSRCQKFHRPQQQLPLPAEVNFSFLLMNFPPIPDLGHSKQKELLLPPTISLLMSSTNWLGDHLNTEQCQQASQCVRWWDWCFQTNNTNKPSVKSKSSFQSGWRYDAGDPDWNHT